MEAVQQVKEEEESNSAEREISLGKLIGYNDVVQLRHTISNCFLSFNPKALGASDGSVEVLLSREGNDFCQFQVFPNSKLFKSGDGVRYKESFILSSVHLLTHYYLQAAISRSDEPIKRKQFLHQESQFSITSLTSGKPMVDSLLRMFSYK